MAVTGVLPRLFYIIAEVIKISLPCLETRGMKSNDIKGPWKK
jgi:hypothetical protein